MDELEFRRNAMIQPNDQQPDFLKTAEASQANRNYLDEMKQFDRSLKRAMQVEVPPDWPSGSCSGKPCCKTVMRQMICRHPDPLARRQSSSGHQHPGARSPWLHRSPSCWE